jgi:hydroxypyruvate reductase
VNPDLLLTHSLRAAPWGAAAARVLAAALAAADPGAAVRRSLRHEGELLYVGERTYDLARIERVLLVSFGKAGLPMARAAADILGERLSGGVVVTKAGQPILDFGFSISDLPLSQSKIGYPAGVNPRSKIQVITSGHPVPDTRSVAAGQAVAGLLAGASERDLVLALISGGGSALFTLPVPDVALDDLQALTRALLASGASINEINTLRKHLDRVKGGGLARLAHPAALAALVLSDVVGSPLDVIASGPAVADTTTFTDAWAVLERYGLAQGAPAPILAHLRRGLAGAIPDTPKPGDPALAGVQNVVVASGAQAAAAALDMARVEGFQTLLLTTYMQGEAREVGRALAAVAREIAASGNPLPRPACLVAGGETTVTLRGDGRGGRNQELALAAVADLAGLERVALVALATDGDDGPTDAAGAVVTGETLARAQALGLDPAAHLAHNDAYPFFAALGDLLRPGPTHTNVNDLTFIFAR